MFSSSLAGIARKADIQRDENKEEDDASFVDRTKTQTKARVLSRVPFRVLIDNKFVVAVAREE
jgi:hypothetical protein